MSRGRLPRPLTIPAVTLALIAASPACGAGEDEERLTVAAAASLREPFRANGEELRASTVRFSFAGSNELAAQIRRGVRPDVYAAANTALPRDLHEEGLVSAPVPFARDRLVIAVPAGSGSVSSLADLAEPGVSVVAGGESVPVGRYARQVLARLARLDAPMAERIARNIRSTEPSVSGVVAKLTQGAADAGFVYLTDARAAREQLEVVEIPAALRPTVELAAAVVEGAARPEAARSFVRGLLDGPGRDALDAAGFEEVPR